MQITCSVPIPGQLTKLKIYEVLARSHDQVRVVCDAGLETWLNILYFSPPAPAFTPTFRKGDLLECVNESNNGLTEGNNYTALEDSYISATLQNREIVKVEGDGGIPVAPYVTRFTLSKAAGETFTPTFRKGDLLDCVVAAMTGLTEGKTYTALGDSYTSSRNREVVEVTGDNGTELYPYVTRFALSKAAEEKFTPKFRKDDVLRCIDSYGAEGELLALVLYRAAADSCPGDYFERVEIVGVGGYFSVDRFEVNQPDVATHDPVASPTLTGKVTYPHDPVNRPAHYTDTAIEVIDYIEDKQFGYHIGQVIKYLSRAGKKGDELEDLRKAQWYLTRKIELLCKK